MMLINGTIPPSGVNESCMLLTAPQLASVVTVAKRAELAMPKRTSFPSMFPPECSAVGVRSAPASSGFPADSAQYAQVTPTRKRKAIAAQTAQPWCSEPVIRPRVYVNPEGIAKINTSCRKLERGVGFSKGCALLALKNPPPLVPNSLITSWDATGPCAITCWVICCVLVLPSAEVICSV